MESYGRAYRDPKSPLTPLTPLACNTAFNFNFAGDSSPKDSITNVEMKNIKKNESFSQFISGQISQLRRVFSPGIYTNNNNNNNNNNNTQVPSIDCNKLTKELEKLTLEPKKSENFLQIRNMFSPNIGEDNDTGVEIENQSVTDSTADLETIISGLETSTLSIKVPKSGQKTNKSFDNENAYKDERKAREKSKGADKGLVDQAPQIQLIDKTIKYANKEEVQKENENVQCDKDKLTTEGNLSKEKDEAAKYEHTEKADKDKEIEQCIENQERVKAKIIMNENEAKEEEEIMNENKAKEEKEDKDKELTTEDQQCKDKEEIKVTKYECEDNERENKENDKGKAEAFQNEENGVTSKYEPKETKQKANKLDEIETNCSPEEVPWFKKWDFRNISFRRKYKQPILTPCDETNNERAAIDINSADECMEIPATTIINMNEIHKNAGHDNKTLSEENEKAKSQAVKVNDEEEENELYMDSVEKVEDKKEDEKLETETTISEDQVSIVSQDTTSSNWLIGRFISRFWQSEKNINASSLNTSEMSSSKSEIFTAQTIAADIEMKADASSSSLNAIENEQEKQPVVKKKCSFMNLLFGRKNKANDDGETGSIDLGTENKSDPDNTSKNYEKNSMEREEEDRGVVNMEEEIIRKLDEKADKEEGTGKMNNEFILQTQDSITKTTQDVSESHSPIWKKEKRDNTSTHQSFTGSITEQELELNSSLTVRTYPYGSENEKPKGDAGDKIIVSNQTEELQKQLNQETPVQNVRFSTPIKSKSKNNSKTQNSAPISPINVAAEQNSVSSIDSIRRTDTRIENQHSQMEDTHDDDDMPKPLKRKKKAIAASESSQEKSSISLIAKEQEIMGDQKVTTLNTAVNAVDDTKEIAMDHEEQTNLSANIEQEDANSLKTENQQDTNDECIPKPMKRQKNNNKIASDKSSQLVAAEQKTANDSPKIANLRRTRDVETKIQPRILLLNENSSLEHEKYESSTSSTETTAVVNTGMQKIEQEIKIVPIPTKEKAQKPQAETVTSLEDAPFTFVLKPKLTKRKNKEKLTAKTTNAESSTQKTTFNGIGMEQIVVDDDEVQMGGEIIAKVINENNAKIDQSKSSQEISNTMPYEWNYWDAAAERKINFRKCSPVSTKPLCPRVEAVLRQAGLGKWEKLFQQEEIDMEVLQTLTVKELEELGIVCLNERMQILTECTNFIKKS